MGWMSTLIPVTFLHVDINKMAWEEHVKKTIPQICQDYIFMRSPAQHPRRSLWWHKLMYILTMNFVCQRVPQSIVEMVRTDRATVLRAAFRSANTQLKRQSCWGRSNQCTITKKCNERMMEGCLREAAMLLGQTVTLLWQSDIFISTSLALPEPDSIIFTYPFYCKQPLPMSDK